MVSLFSDTKVSTSLARIIIGWYIIRIGIQLPGLCVDFLKHRCVAPCKKHRVPRPRRLSHPRRSVGAGWPHYLQDRIQNTESCPFCPTAQCSRQYHCTCPPRSRLNKRSGTERQISVAPPRSELTAAPPPSRHLSQCPWPTPRWLLRLFCPDRRLPWRTGLRINRPPTRPTRGI